MAVLQLEKKKYIRKKGRYRHAQTQRTHIGMNGYFTFVLTEAGNHHVISCKPKKWS